MFKTAKPIIATLLAGVMFCMLCIPAKAENVVASSMKLLKTEGTVAVLDKNQASVSLFKGMKLQNGYEVATSTASYAWINLDDTKLIKLDALTNVGVEQNGKNLTLTLNSGKILVDVSKKLDSDETLNVKTGNVVTGVRGTLFEVAAEDPYFANTDSIEIIVLEGTVSATSTDLINGKVSEIYVPQGNKSTYTIDRTNGTTTRFLTRAKSSDVSGFSAVELALNDNMRKRAVNGSPDISLPSLAGALDRLSKDILLQQQYVERLALLRGESVQEAIYYKVGVPMNYYGQTSDGQYISGINPNTGEAQYKWNPIDSSGGVYRPETGNTEGGNAGGAEPSEETNNDDGDDSGDTPEPRRGSSSRGPDAGGGGGIFD